MTEDTQTQNAEDTETPAPDATISITWNGAGFTFDVSHGTDLAHPSAFFADWFKRNAEPLSGIAASEFGVRRDAMAHATAEAEIAIAAAQLQAQADGGQSVVDSATPRLLSASGGPLN